MVYLSNRPQTPIKKISIRSQPHTTFIKKKPKNSTTPSDPNYIIPPNIAADKKISPITTSLPLNDILISHLTKWQFSSSQAFANTANNDIILNGIFKLNGRVMESLTRDNIYTVDQKASYLQLRSVSLDRKVTTRTIEPKSLTGLEISMSLTADCIFPDTPNDQKCSYTPSIITDRNSIDSDFLVPTRISQTSQAGEIVKPETLALMERPGFQAGTSTQPIGLELYFPNAGAFPGNTQSQKTQIERKEENNYTAFTINSRIRQVVKANDTEAVLGRTIQGFVFFNDENQGLNTTIQGVAQFLPDIIPDLKGSENPVNSRINRHLFLAPNNTRLPGNSYTIYSAGVGRAKSLTPDITSLSQVPKGSYHSIWLGLSPIIDRSINQGRTFYDPTSPQVATTSSGSEGGEGSNVDFTSAINQDTFSTVSQDTFSTPNLRNFYVQVYLKFLEQDANLVQESIYQEKTSYYPHLSFAGNWTGSQDLFRYYTGAIASEKIKFYLGFDYTISTVNGWKFRTGGIGYINPDRDYYSQIFGNATKTFRISKNANFTLSTFFNYAIDRDTKIGSVVSNSPASALAARARLNWGRSSVGVTYYFGDVIPNSFEDRLLLELSIRPLKTVTFGVTYSWAKVIPNSFEDRLLLKLSIRPLPTVTFSSFVAPIDKTSNSSPYGANVTWKLKNKYNSPTLSLNWQNQKHNYADDPFGNKIIVNDNNFTVMFRLSK
jgi:hypothetical protein